MIGTDYFFIFHQFNKIKILECCCFFFFVHSTVGEKFIENKVNDGDEMKGYTKKKNVLNIQGHALNEPIFFFCLNRESESGRS